MTSERGLRNAQQIFDGLIRQSDGFQVDLRQPHRRGQSGQTEECIRSARHKSIKTTEGYYLRVRKMRAQKKIANVWEETAIVDSKHKKENEEEGGEIS